MKIKILKLTLSYRDKWKFIIIFLVLLSFTFIIGLLIGGLTGNVYLKKLNFDTKIRNIIHRENIKFTLFGYCIDNKCTKKISYNFDKSERVLIFLSTCIVNYLLLIIFEYLVVPSSEEIQSGKVSKRSKVRINIIRAPIEEKVKSGGKKLVDDVGIEHAEKEILKKLFEAFDNFSPKKSISYSSALLAKPIIVASVLNFMTLIILIFINQDNYVMIYFISNLLLLTTTLSLLITLATTITLYSSVLNGLNSFPGIENNNTGLTIPLLICSIICLIISISVITARCCGCLRDKSKVLKIRF